jgi:hypothetical protein
MTVLPAFTRAGLTRSGDGRHRRVFGGLPVDVTSAFAGAEVLPHAAMSMPATNVAATGARCSRFTGVALRVAASALTAVTRRIPTV